MNWEFASDWDEESIEKLLQAQSTAIIGGINNTYDDCEMDYMFLSGRNEPNDNNGSIYKSFPKRREK